MSELINEEIVNQSNIVIQQINIPKSGLITLNEFGNFILNERQMLFRSLSTHGIEPYIPQNNGEYILSAVYTTNSEKYIYFMYRHFNGYVYEFNILIKNNMIFPYLMYFEEDNQMDESKISINNVEYLYYEIDISYFHNNESYELPILIDKNLYFDNYEEFYILIKRMLSSYIEF